MAENTSVEFDFQVEDPENLKPFEQYKDADFPTGLIDNLREAGFKEPTHLQQCILKCMNNKLGIIGNVPINVNAEVAYISYAIAECKKAKQENTYKTIEYKPFALFIAKDEEMMQKYYDIATELAKDLDVSTVCLTLKQFKDETYCEFAMQDCDLVFLAADGFNSFVKDELVIFESLKVLVVHDLGWEDDKKRYVQYKDMFTYHDFPKAGERILIFFDSSYSPVANEVMKDDPKGVILFENGDSAKDLDNFADGTQDYVPPKTEEVFEICVSDEEKDAAIVKFMQSFDTEFRNDPRTCPRSIVYVKNHPIGMHVKGLFLKNRMHPWHADGHRKRTDTQVLVQQFQNGCTPILIACDLHRLGIPIVFDNITNIVFYDFPDTYYLYKVLSQVDDGNKPKKVISLVGGADYEACKALLDNYNNEKRDVGMLQPVVTALKPLYDAIPHSDDDYYGYDSQDDDYYP